ncbi:MAG: CPBP family intramembrane metalloprotease [Acidobacteria bacterium]|nr:CPBP family intramembrane metalloprotease [Acidobacteriota bacterium]
MFPPPAEVAAPARRVISIERAGAIFEIILCSGFPTQLLLIAGLRACGMDLEGTEGGLNPRFVFTVSLLDAVLVVGLVVMFLHARGESARDVLLGRVRLLKEAFVGIALIPVVFMVVIAILAIVLTYAPQLHNVTRNPLEDMMRNRTDAAIFAVVVLIAGGVREEVQRGFIVHRFGQYLGGGIVGVLFYSVLFGLGHYEQGYDAALSTAALGALWGLVYLRRGSIVAPMVSHAGFNLAQILKYVALR